MTISDDDAASSTFGPYGRRVVITHDGFLSLVEMDDGGKGGFIDAIAV